jgi:hypothetical protein
VIKYQAVPRYEVVGRWDPAIFAAVNPKVRNPSHLPFPTLTMLVKSIVINTSNYLVCHLDCIIIIFPIWSQFSMNVGSYNVAVNISVILTFVLILPFASFIILCSGIWDGSNGCGCKMASILCAILKASCVKHFRKIDIENNAHKANLFGNIPMN